jgi:hypothetical protein
MVTTHPNNRSAVEVKSLSKGEGKRVDGSNGNVFEAVRTEHGVVAKLRRCNANRAAAMLSTTPPEDVTVV